MKTFLHNWLISRIKGWLFYMGCLSLSGVCWAKKTGIFILGTLTIMILIFVLRFWDWFRVEWCFDTTIFLKEGGGLFQGFLIVILLTSTLILVSQALLLTIYWFKKYFVKKKCEEGVSSCHALINSLGSWQYPFTCPPGKE